MTKSLLVLASTGAMAFALATPAFAQEAQDDSQQGIREIVVTAQKREESIQDVPIAVTALDQEMLDSATVEDLRDL
ncbi:MAG: TonB-dependent receptor, partial [Sphingomonadales bacterium]|nr:TonB-dependent receptor [Sphingomonadales bacterium]